MQDNDWGGQPFLLPPTLIETFIREGVVVIPDVFSADEVAVARKGLAETLLTYGMDVMRLEETAGHLRQLSSTGGSGGVLDLFYPDWKLRLAESPRFFDAVSQLWAATWAHPDQQAPLYEHPYEPFNPERGYFYLDRVGYRVPDSISDHYRKGKRPLQRSLTPHLDCCPSALYASGKEVPRFRPIQTMIALTDNHRHDAGGFECVKGFHREFAEWAERRVPSVSLDGPIPAPCVGDFTPIRPEEDRDVIERFESVVYSSGSVIAFDFRIPHANAATNRADVAREVVYGGFLPDVAINRRFAVRQRERFWLGLRPDDQWIGPHAEVAGSPPTYVFSLLGQRLLGDVPWSPAADAVDVAMVS